MSSGDAAAIISWAVLIAGISVGWDVSSYSRRQDEWERRHPGSTYIRGYRKKMKKGKL